MNIKEAKEQIQNAIKAYFTKDEFNNYIIPIERQRPIFLEGAPGIGKTAIMEQIASELDVGLVSYSMTHHTRQSALGLPFIEKKTFGGKEYSVSEYTMSEIIASVYNMIEETGHKEGILFLDEINCVSETLAPAMLQFLQYKIFGTHKIPDGWIVVTAGNPPEYNNSVREFDVAIWDRLKRVVVEPDYKVWREYAIASGIHAAILTYLNIKSNNFYKIETTVDGKSFVTARGWCDLSDIMKLYDKNDIAVDKLLISQYIQNKEIAKDFSNYYELFKKYKSDYKIDTILDGQPSEEIKSRAKKANFDERYSLIGLISDAVFNETKKISQTEDAIKELVNRVRLITNGIIKPNFNINEVINGVINGIEEIISKGKLSSSLSKNKEYIYRKTITYLNDIQSMIIEQDLSTKEDIAKAIHTYLATSQKDLMTKAKETRTKLTNSFNFLDEVFESGQEMLMYVTQLTLNPFSVTFISSYGCPEYFKHNKELLFTDRQNELEKQIKELDLDL